MLRLFSPLEPTSRSWLLPLHLAILLYNDRVALLATSLGMVTWGNCVFTYLNRFLLNGGRFRRWIISSFTSMGKVTSMFSNAEIVVSASFPERMGRLHRSAWHTFCSSSAMQQPSSSRNMRTFTARALELTFSYVAT